MLPFEINAGIASLKEGESRYVIATYFIINEDGVISLDQT